MFQDGPELQSKTVPQNKQNPDGQKVFYFHFCCYDKTLSKNKRERDFFLCLILGGSRFLWGNQGRQFKKLVTSLRRER